MQNNRIVWLDVTRLVAMFTVVCCHCADPFNFYPGEPPAEIPFWGQIYGALLRPCVPLFVMITGALLLPIREETSVFYKKRISRVFWPFLIWSVLYCLFPWFTKLLGFAPEVIIDFFPYAGEKVLEQSFSNSLEFIAQIPFNFMNTDVHMWYIYLLIGLYLYLPIFSAWVEKASERSKRWFLIAWMVTTLLPYYYEYVNPYIWGGCAWNHFPMLYYFAGFNGYLLLGHYLRHTEWSLSKTLTLGIPLFIIGYAVTYIGFKHMAEMPGHTEEQFELFFTYNSLNVVMMTIPVFMLTKLVQVRSPKIQAVLANLTLCGFGVYMVHYILTGPSIVWMRALNIPVCIQIPVGAVISFGLSWLIVLLIRKISGRYARYIIG